MEYLFLTGAIILVGYLLYREIVKAEKINSELKAANEELAAYDKAIKEAKENRKIVESMSDDELTDFLRKRH
jgi:hypothetical protein